MVDFFTGLLVRTLIAHYISYSISITFISWVVGIIVNGILRKTEYYKNISNLNFIKSKTLNKSIGLGVFKWIVRNTFFKLFNPKLKLERIIDQTDLNELRKEMTYAELNHLIGFAFVTVFALIKLFNGEFLFALIFMTVNILVNLYPSLLQQENKRRIDRLMKNFK